MNDPISSMPCETPGETEMQSLVRAIVGQDEAALSRLYDLTVGRVYGLAYRMVGNSADAEEITCDVYLQVWRRAAQYDPLRGPVIAWLLINCRSLALDLLRRQRTQQLGQERLALKENEEVDEVTAEDLLNSLQEGTAVHRALGELTEIQCRLIALAYFKGLSHQEIAESVQLPLGTVKSHIRRGLQRLRKYLDR